MRIGACALVMLALLTRHAAQAASLPPTASTTGLVVADQRLAAEAGVDILRQGGNAIDAAVAVGYAEAVVNPCCGNIGGGGFLTTHLADGRDIFLNFRETAPAAATREMYLDRRRPASPRRQPARLEGGRRPGSVLGLDTALLKYGRCRAQAVMAPAIRLAREGFVLTAADADILGPRCAATSPGPGSGTHLPALGRTPPQAGDRLRQPELALKP